MTITCSNDLLRIFILHAMATTVALSCFFTFFIPQTHAAQPTEAQIGAVVNLLVIFKVDQPTIDDVERVLYKSARSKPGVIAGTSTPPTPSITLTAPNGGEQWELGVMGTITWTPYSYSPDVNPSSDITAYLEKRVPVFQTSPFFIGIGTTSTTTDRFVTVGTILPSGKASIHWEGDLNTYGNYPSPGTYYIRIVNNKTGAWDRSDRPFTITPKSADLKLNNSDGPIIIALNQKIKATWTSTDSKGCTLYNAYDTPGANSTVLSGLPSSGSRTVYVPVQQNWYVTLFCEKNSGISVYDSVAVNIQSVKATLKVTHPNGGENIKVGEPYTIRWNQKGLNHISVALYMNDQWLEWIEKDAGPDAVNSGKYIWTPGGVKIQEFTSLGKIFKIYITGQKIDGTGYVDDKSDQTFGFKGALSPASAIKVTAPNGGEQWELGTINTITWTPYDPTTGINPSGDVSAYLIKNLVRNPERGDTYSNIGQIVPSGKASIHWEGLIRVNDEGTQIYPEPGQYNILVINNKTGQTDFSDKSFKLLPRPVDLKINGSDSLVSISDIDQQVVVSWTGLGVSRCQLSGIKEISFSAIQPSTGSVAGRLASFNTDGGVGYGSVYIQCQKQNASGVVSQVSDSGSVRITNVSTILSDTEPIPPTTTSTAPPATTDSVSSSSAPAPTCTLKASNTRVSAGKTVTLKWKSKNTTHASSASGDKDPAEGSVKVTPEETTIYQKTVYGSGGEGTCTVQVEVKGSTIETPVKTQAALPTEEESPSLTSTVMAAAAIPFEVVVSVLSEVFLAIGVQ